jgi:hypothetical protein
VPGARDFAGPRTGHDFSRVPAGVARLTQTRLKVSRPGDAAEREADAVAHAVMREGAPGPTAPREGRAAHAVQLKHASAALPQGAGGFSTRLERARGGGRELPAPVRSFFEPRFGYDFGGVRLHDDARAGELTRALNARAFTVGGDLFMGRGEYAPETEAGRHLLAHELTHVIQQQSHAQIQRQEIPEELRQSVDYSTMTDDELQDRYDLITETLALFNESSAETELLEKEAGEIGIELGRRMALAAGRTFSEDAIERMRQYFVGNAKSASPDSCIAAMNKGVRLLYDDPSQKMGSDVEASMQKLVGANRAGAARVIEFEDSRGRITTGTRRPEKLHESVWDVLVGLAGGDPGWSVFGMSLMDGYHSVTLTLDNRDPAAPVVYWSDQWSSKGGWMKYDRAKLDADVTKLTQGWWDPQPEGRKHNTKTTLWRLKR